MDEGFSGDDGTEGGWRGSSATGDTTRGGACPNSASRPGV